MEHAGHTSVVNTVPCILVTGYDLETNNETTKQRPLLGNRFSISKYTQPLLSKAFANKHIPMEKIGVQQ
jgi:hypothetical protein